MKKINLGLLALLISFVLVSCGKKDDTGTTTGGSDKKETMTETSSDTKKTSTEGESVKIVMDMKADKMNGTVTIFRKGDKGKVISKNDIGGQKTETTVYTDADYLYSITDIMGQKMATKTKIDKSKDTPAGTKNDIDYLASHWDKYEKVGTETILGKECVIRKISDKSTVSVYDDKYPLKFTTPAMTMEAKSFDYMDVPDSEMQVPTDVTFKEFNPADMKKNLKENMKDIQDLGKNLKDAQEKMKK